ncbi:choice-of-anchor M domain-containing protein [Actinomycetaceae bacterium L2_0104]
MILSARRTLVWRLAAAGVSLLALLAGCGPSAEEHPEQQGPPVESLAPDTRVLGAGRAMVEPAFREGQWQLAIYETEGSSDGAEGVWRSPNRTVLGVGPAERVEVPDSEALSFLDAEPGDTIWAVQDVEGPALSLGFSLDSDEALRSIDGGANILLTGVQGPGTLIAYTTDGDSKVPQPVWDSRDAFPQPYSLELGDQRGMNWSFTEPGVYLVQLTVQATLVDGSAFSDTQILRFNVDSGLDAEQVLSFEWVGPQPEAYFEPGEAVQQEQDTGTDLTDWLLRGSVILLVVMALTAAVMLARHRSRKRSPNDASKDERADMTGEPL